MNNVGAKQLSVCHSNNPKNQVHPKHDGRISVSPAFSPPRKSAKPSSSIKHTAMNPNPMRCVGLMKVSFVVVVVFVFVSVSFRGFLSFRVREDHNFSQFNLYPLNLPTHGSSYLVCYSPGDNNESRHAEINARLCRVQNSLVVNCLRVPAFLRHTAAGKSTRRENNRHCFVLSKRRNPESPKLRKLRCNTQTHSVTIDVGAVSRIPRVLTVDDTR